MTFDTPGNAVVNVLGITVFIAALVVGYRQRKIHRLSGAAVLCIVIGFTVDGVYVPLGPVIFLLARATWARNPTLGT